MRTSNKNSEEVQIRPAWRSEKGLILEKQDLKASNKMDFFIAVKKLVKKSKISQIEDFIHNFSGQFSHTYDLKFYIYLNSEKEKKNSAQFYLFPLQQERKEGKGEWHKNIEEVLKKHKAK